ncbi:efflux RND transporter periplasmic adaptor subunit [Aeromonas fluvialis]|uniref:efflux RND transporter periplasmic adaptor subunit n=1 Tax=Aeromonas fluvialis TaxID=591962 RepID=UPI001AD8394F|nr:HlyD family secretion protein [Aeromonas fluvialis]
MAVVALAAWLIFTNYHNYLVNPWTRDGQVRAQIIQITPRVTGVITELPIKDNQEVKRGELLFRIDPRPYLSSLNQARASVAKASASIANAEQELNRARALLRRDPGALSKLNLEQLENTYASAKAAKEEALALEEQAQLNLTFTEILAPSDGYITNLNLQQGAQAVANSPAVALIDRNSFWVHGFFKETDIANVRPKDRALITLMTYPDIPLEGEVDSIGYGIAQSDGSMGHNLLPTINPSFQWIRLAQRLPVRIHLKQVPPEIVLRVGTTASVLIQTNTQNK